MQRSHLALIAVAALVLVAPSAAAAQIPEPDPAALPSLLIVSADLRQTGQDLRLRLRFSRDIPVKEIEPAKGRYACLVLGPQVPSRRRVCVSRRDGRLRATMSPIDEAGNARGRALVLRRASVAIDDDVLVLRAPARSLRVKTGLALTWQALVSWKDGGACEAVPEPNACIQVVPGSGVRQLRTRRAPQRPSFVGQGHLRLLATGDSMIQIIDSFLKAAARAPARDERAQRCPHQHRPVEAVHARLGQEGARAGALGAPRRHRDVHRGQRRLPDEDADGRERAVLRRRVDRRVRPARRVDDALLHARRALVRLLADAPDAAPRGLRAHLPLGQQGDQAGGGAGGRGARVIDLVKVFTPGGRFRQYVNFRGKNVNARQGDGVHLSTGGASIAATLLIDRLRADHALPRLR